MDHQDRTIYRRHFGGFIVRRTRVIGLVIIEHALKRGTLKRLQILGFGLGVFYPEGQTLGGQPRGRILFLKFPRVG